MLAQEKLQKTIKSIDLALKNLSEENYLAAKGDIDFILENVLEAKYLVIAQLELIKLQEGDEEHVEETT